MCVIKHIPYYVIAITQCHVNLIGLECDKDTWRKAYNITRRPPL